MYNLVPFDIAAFTMAHGTADSGGEDNCQASAEGQVNQDLRGEARNVESPEEKRHKDNSATDTQETGQESGSAAQEDKQGYGCDTEGAHGYQKAEQVSRVMADLLIVEAPTRFELVMEILQTSALPLGDGAIKKELL